MQDKVSIITPSWNSEKYIEKTIESVQKQTYMNWEMIVVDDCSTDRTVEIVEKISKEDPRVRIIRQEVNGGAAKARNRSLCEATGRYIAYLDADDIWKPTKLEKQVEFMKANHCGFSCASYEVIDDEGRASSAEQMCKDVGRLSEDQWEAVNAADQDAENGVQPTRELEALRSTCRVAILYALGYLYEHRDEADHKQLMLTLRSILFAVREGVF